MHTEYSARPETLPHLADQEVHVWSASLRTNTTVLQHCSKALSLDETERAAKFRFAQHQQRFVVGRSLLRHLIAGYLGIDPCAVQFEHGKHGKPRMVRDANGTDIHFNLAHSEDMALCGFSRIAPVGIDIEQVASIKEATALVARFFSPNEIRRFERLPPEEKSFAFYRLWTRKESLLKATGEGIGASLNKVEVSFLPNEPARVIAIGGDRGAARRWSLFDVSPMGPWMAALAIPAQKVRVRCWNWEWRDLKPAGPRRFVSDTPAAFSRRSHIF
jgi:4'-phosphopantetheinyl transferase